MKKQFVVVLVLALIVSTISSCAPAPTSTTSSGSPSTSSFTSSDDIVKPSMFLVDDEGTKTYAVYFFINRNGENCVVVADNYIAPDGNSNSAPAIYCH